MMEWIVELTEQERWFYGIIFGGISFLIANWLIQWLVHSLAIKRERHKNIVAASATFRTAINPAIFGEMKGHQLHGALINYFPVFKSAVHEYQISLGWMDRLRLNSAWNKYHGGNEEYPDFFKTYCIKANGPEFLRERLNKLRSIGNKR